MNALAIAALLSAFAAILTALPPVILLFRRSSPEPASNRRPPLYESGALPTELSGHACNLRVIAAVPGLEPGLRGPEPRGLPITPYRMARRPSHSGQVGSAQCPPPPGATRADDPVLDIAPRGWLLGHPGVLVCSALAVGACGRGGTRTRIYGF